MTASGVASGQTSVRRLHDGIASGFDVGVHHVPLLNWIAEINDCQHGAATEAIGRAEAAYLAQLFEDVPPPRSLVPVGLAPGCEVDVGLLVGSRI